MGLVEYPIVNSNLLTRKGVIIYQTCRASLQCIIRWVFRGCGSMVECGLPKAETRVRFPSPAPITKQNIEQMKANTRKTKVKLFAQETTIVKGRSKGVPLVIPPSTRPIESEQAMLRRVARTARSKQTRPAIAR